MKRKFTRREMAAGLMAAAPVFATAAPDNAGKDPLAAAREQVHDTAKELAKFDLPMSAEPAFVFKP